MPVVLLLSDSAAPLAIELSWPALARWSGQTVAVRNLTGRAVTIPPVLDDTASTLGRVVSVVPATDAVVPGGALRHVVLTVREPARLAAGTHHGALRLTDTGGRSFVVRVRVAVPPAVLVKAWTVRVARVLPTPAFSWSFYTAGRDVPLAHRANHAALPAEADVGGSCGAARSLLTSDSGHVLFACGARVAPFARFGAERALRLHVEEARRAGIYQGDLRLPAGGDTGLPLTVRVTDFVLWPLLAIALGLWLAHRARRYLAVDRFELDLGRRLYRASALLAEGAGELLPRLREHGVGLDESAVIAYLRAMDARRDRTLRRVAEVRGAGGTAAPALAEMLQAIDALVGDFEKEGRAWRDAGDALLWAAQSVAAARADARAAWSRITAPPADGEPLVLQAVARELAVVAAIPDAAALEAAAGRLRTAAERLLTWTRATDRWIAAERIASSPASPVEEACAAAAMRALLDTARVALWRATDVASLADGSEFDRAVDAVEACGAPLRTRTARAARAPRTPGDQVAAAAEAPGDVASARSRADHYERLLRERDTQFLLLSAAVAVVGWLTTSYLDRPFGSLRDYLQALVWGFGTTTGLALVRELVSRLGSAAGALRTTPAAVTPAAVTPAAVTPPPGIAVLPTTRGTR